MFFGRDRIVSLLDQGLVAATRFLALALLARFLTKHEFGVAALAITVSYMCIGLQRAAVALPFANLCPDKPSLDAEGWKWYALNLFLAAFCGLLLLGLGSITPIIGAPSWAGEVLWLSGVLSPPTVIFEFMRRWLFQWQQDAWVLVQSTVMAVTTAVSLPLCVLAHTSAWSGILTLAGAYLAGVLAVSRVQAPRFRREWMAGIQSLSRSRNFVGWTIGEFLFDSVQNHGMNLIVGGMTGPVGGGIFAAVRNVVAPITTMVSAFGVSEMPRLSRAVQAGREVLTRAMLSSMSFQLLISTPFLLAVGIFAEPVLRLFYGPAFAGHATGVRLAAVAVFLLVILRSLDMWLLATGAARWLVVCKATGAIAALSAAVLLVPKTGITGALVSVVVGTATNLGTAVGAVICQYSKKP